VYSDIEGAKLFHASDDPRQTRNLWASAEQSEKQRILNVISSNSFLSDIYRP
jgi:hypothetical protein